MRRHYAYALLTEAEYRIVTERAQKAGLSVSNYVLLLEEGDDVPLLEEQQPGRKKTA